MNKYLLRNIILISTVLIAAVVFTLVFYSGKTAGSSFEITVNGKQYGSYPLDKDAEINVDGHCTVRVKDGQVFITESDCPGKDCVHHKPISMTGERIVCLPNGIVIRISGDGVDALI